MRAFNPVVNCYLLLMMRDLNVNMLVSVKEGQSTCTFNSLVFYTNSEVDFGFAGISDTVSDGSIAMSVTPLDDGHGLWQRGPNFYPSRL